jgi:hypothetical protein
MGEYTVQQLYSMIVLNTAILIVPAILKGVFWWWEDRESVARATSIGEDRTDLGQRAA